MPRAGTLVICVQNLDFSGANQVVLNIVSGHLHESNVIVLSPKVGTFAARFVETGAAVRFGDLSSLLDEIKDVFCIICNTIMTAQHVVDMAKRPHPVIWILHEWWDDKMITENLKMRNMAGLTLETVKDALQKASCVVFVCEAQRRLYGPTTNSAVIYVGVPAPLHQTVCEIKRPVFDDSKFTFLCLGIVCPRKNQVWAVELFRAFAAGRKDVRLLIVGARYTRDYEIQYVEEVKEAINGDHRIELFDVTENVDHFYQVADALLMTSINEVTPMVISEAMAWGIPILSTNIAGIPEMFTDGVEGFLFSPGDNDKAIAGMAEMVNDPELCQLMGLAGTIRFAAAFDLENMVEKYRELMLKVAPPVLLLDMDGAIVDWDAGFRKLWADRSLIDRQKSYYMQQCVENEFYHEAELLILEEGFFENLPEMPGAIQAIKEMEETGFRVFICTSPILTSRYCAQEKLNWIRNYLGERWLDKVILSHDKTVVRGDLLIDDKPFEFMAPGGRHTTATWKQVVFDAPYNSEMTVPRLNSWSEWKEVIMPLFGKMPKTDPYAMQYGESVTGPPLPKSSPKSHRNEMMLKADRTTAEWQQNCLLGKLNNDKEPLSPEYISAMKGSGSLFDDNLQENYPANNFRGRCPSPITTILFVNGTKSVSNEATNEAKHSQQESNCNGVEGASDLSNSSGDSSSSNYTPINGEDRFGGDDDYADNFQTFRHAYRQWRMDGKTAKCQE